MNLNDLVVVHLLLQIIKSGLNLDFCPRGTVSAMRKMVDITDHKHMRRLYWFRRYPYKWLTWRICIHGIYDFDMIYYVKCTWRIHVYDLRHIDWVMMKSATTVLNGTHVSSNVDFCLISQNVWRRTWCDPLKDNFSNIRTCPVVES